MTDAIDPHATDTRPPIDEQWLERMRSTKPEFLARLFEVFLAEEPQRIARLGEVATKGDLKQTHYLAHSLKGAAATLGMERLRDACRELERASKDGETGRLPGLFAMVRREVEAVFAMIQDL